MGERRNVLQVAVGKPEIARFFKDLVVNGREILN
jgi:hypothetical protein